MKAKKFKFGYVVGVVMLLSLLACNGIGRQVLEQPVVQPVSASNSTATPAPAPAGPEQVPATPAPTGEDNTRPEATSEGSAMSPTGPFNPGGALAGADSYALTIDSAQGQVTFKVVKSKKEYQVISGGQGASTEMYIKNDTLYTLAAGNCVGVPLKPGDMDSLAGMGDFTTFTTGLGHETLVGTEEVNGVKTDHYQATGPNGSVDIWASQDGGYLVRLVGQGPSGQVQIDVTDVNALGEIGLPEACAKAMTLPNFQ